MKTKPLTLLLSLTFLFLFSGSSVVFGGDKSEVKKISLICKASHYSRPTGETQTASEPPSSLIIFPNSKVIQTKDSTFLYEERANKITWSDHSSSLWKDHILDRVIGVYIKILLVE